MLDSNKIYCGNCMDLMKFIDDNSIDLIVTDPPYKTTSRGSHGNSGGMMKNKIYMDGKVFAHNDITPNEYAPEFYRVLKDGAHCYVMTNHLNLISILNTFTNCGFHFIKSLIWDKHKKIMGQYYMNQFEYILFFRKGYGKHINNCGTSDIITVIPNKHKDETGKNLHDTEKPVRLMEVLIENSSSTGDIVFDPFMGIGTTCIAAIKHDRKYIGVEIDEKYFKIANERLNNA